MGEITYEDIKKKLSKDDLAQYNLLSKEFVALVGNKAILNFGRCCKTLAG